MGVVSDYQVCHQKQRFKAVISHVEGHAVREGTEKPRLLISLHYWPSVNFCGMLMKTACHSVFTEPWFLSLRK